MKSRIGLLILSCLVLAFGCSEDTVVRDEATRQEIDDLNDQVFDMRIKEKDKALLITQKALLKALQIGYDEGEYHAYLNKGILFNIKSEHDSAAKYLYKSEFYFRAKNTRQEGLANYYLGRVHKRLQNLETAKRYYEKSAKIFESCNELGLLAFAKNSLGILNGMQAKYLDALYFFSEALALKEEANVSTKEVLDNISIVYRRLGKYDEGLEFAGQALEISVKENDSVSISYKHNTIGDLLSDKGMADSALFHYYTALQIGKEHADKSIIANALYEIGYMYQEKSDHRKAIDLYQSILADAGENGILREYVWSALGESYLNINMLDSAIHFASLAIESTKQKRFTAEVISSGEVLKQAYQKLGDWKPAFEYAELLEKYRDTLEINNQESRFSDLRVLLETKDQEKTINSLEKQREIDSLAKQRLIYFIGMIVLILSGISLIIYTKARNQARIKEIENENLKKEAEKNKKKLYEQALHMVYINNMYNRIEEDLRNLKQIPEIKKVLQKISIDKSLEKEWNNFKNYFSNVHSDFQKQIDSRQIQLTENERRICSLIKVNLTNREIASLLNINEKSVRMSKYRLKKKLNLSEQEDLKEFILKLN